MSKPQITAYLNAKFSDKRTHPCWICGTSLNRKTATADHIKTFNLLIQRGEWPIDTLIPDLRSFQA